MAFGKYSSFLKNTILLSSDNNEFKCFGINKTSACNINSDDIKEEIINNSESSEYNLLYKQILEQNSTNTNIVNDVNRYQLNNNKNLNTFNSKYYISQLNNNISIIDDNISYINENINNFSEQLVELSANIDTSKSFYNDINIIHISNLNNLSTTIDTLSNNVNILLTSTTTSVDNTTKDIKTLNEDVKTFNTWNTNNIKDFNSAITNISYVPNTLSDYVISTVLTYNNELEIAGFSLNTIVPKDIFNNLKFVNGYDDNIIEYISTNYNIYYINSKLSVEKNKDDFIKTTIYLPEYEKTNSNLFTTLSIFIKNVVDVVTRTGYRTIRYKDPETGEMVTKREQITIKENNQALASYALSVSFALIRNTISVNVDT